MQAYRVETIVGQNGTLTLTNLPFLQGETIEVILLVQPFPALNHPMYPLRGTPVTYLDPFEPVAQTDWEVCQ
jgi:hypothetical protein